MGGIKFINQGYCMSSGILLLTHLASQVCASFTSPSSSPHIEAQGSVMQTTSCQIKFEWIAGMTSIPSEWICRELSSLLARRLASRGIVVSQEAVTRLPMQLPTHVSLLTVE